MSSTGRRPRILLPAAAALIALCGAAWADAGNPARARKPSPEGDAWPRTVRLGPAGSVSLDQPRAESLVGTKLKAHGTIRVQRAEEGESSGTAWYEADVRIDRDQRTVTMTSVEVPRVELSGARPAFQQRLAARIGAALTRMPAILPLDDVLAAARLAGRGAETSAGLRNDPPRILFETEPAILVVFDGEPRFRAVEGFRLERALNTPFLVLRDPGSGACYLSGGTSWFRAPDPKGPWTRTEDVPPDAVAIARRDLKDAGVADTEVEQAKKSAEKQVPKILVTTEPAELIVSEGAPVWSAIVPGELEAMDNSESDVFRTLPDHQYWTVLSGRWFRSDSYSGPWTHVEPDQLPPGFRRIPADSAKADALAFVPGTDAAREALADAEKPRTAAVRRSEAHLAVTYDGEPRFEPVAGTKVEYAVNTADQVLRIRGRYYACDQGVWFAAESPTGPWRAADSLPEEDIQTIPPESPVYNTRFAYVYDSTPDAVYEAYTPAYLGSYPYRGAVVFGTGWYYRPWWGAFYYPRLWTWGFHARYAPWAGWGWGFGWGRAWAGFRFGFGYGWGARWCGPGGFFRPGFRNVNITRNVNVTRNVTRNIYASGANSARAAATRGTGRSVGAAAASHTAASRATSGTRAAGRTASGAAGARAGGAKSGAKSKALKGGHAKAGKGGGGKKR